MRRRIAEVDVERRLDVAVPREFPDRERAPFVEFLDQADDA